MILDGNARLPGHVRPTRYALRLTLQPGGEQLHGRVYIDAQLEQATDRIQLHGEDLHIHHAIAEIGDQRQPLRLTPGKHGALLLSLPQVAPIGPIRLELGWTTPIGRVPEGLYAVHADGADYLFTQLEPLAARRVFPCFDEPGFKARYAVTIEAPRGDTVLANGRCIQRRSLPESVEWRFAETPPISSYLVAFAVGPFDLVQAPAGSCRVPLRVATTRGRGHLAEHALAVTPGLLEALEARIGVPYPYDKLDLLGVPDFAAGAMENVGLITFREQLLLLDPDHAPLHDQMWAEIVIAHELAHMWFGNLVTMQWWDELWLNEAFATHLETHAVHVTAPHYEVDLEAVRETGRVMEHDALLQARSIRQPVLDGGDILNAFDSITYGKGAAVVQMLRAWLGAEAFDAGIANYLRTHAHGTATTTDLIAALAESTGQTVAPTLLDFLDQAGVPLVELTPVNPERRQWRACVRRYHTGGTSGPIPCRWRIPLTLRYGTSDGPRTFHTLLHTLEQTLTLDAPATWLHPSADERGYYRWQLPTADLTRLAEAPLSRPERVALPAHLWALLEAEVLEADGWCAVIQTLAADPHRLVLSTVIDGLRRLGQVVPRSQRAQWAAFVRHLLEPHAQRLGPWLDPADTVNDRLARPEIITALVDLGDHRTLRTTLTAQVGTVLSDLGQTTADQARLVLPAAAAQGDRHLLDQITTALPTAPTPAHRGALITTLGSFREPTLLNAALEAFLSPTVRAQDLFALLRPAAQSPATRAIVWAWLDQRYAAVVEKVGTETAAHLPRLGSSAVTKTERAQIAAFFESTERRAPGTHRALQQVLEGIDRNTRLAERVCEPITRFLDGVGLTQR